MSESISRGVNSPELMREALAHHQAGRLQQAQALYREVLQASPGHADANHNLGVVELQLNQAAMALAHLKAALDANPAQGQYWLSYIAALMQAGQPEAARQVLGQGRSRGLSGLQVEELARRLGGAAGSTALPAVGVSAGPTRAEIEQVVGLFGQARYGEAEQLARGLTERYARHGFGWKVLGAVLKQLGRDEQALGPMQRAVGLLPKDFEAHYNLGNALRRLGRLVEAEASCRRVVALKPDFAEAFNNLGATCQSNGKLQEAEASFRRAIELNPQLSEAFCNLGNVLTEQGALVEAEHNFRRALELDPTHEKYWSSYAAFINTARQSGLNVTPLANPMRTACLLRSSAKSEFDRAVLEECRNYLTGPDMSWQDKETFLRLCDFTIDSPREWVCRLFEQVVIPALGEILVNRDLHLALNLYNQALFAVGLEPHTQAQWAYCTERMNPLFAEAGQSVSKDLPELPLPESSADVSLVAFIVDSAIDVGSGLSLLINILAELSKHSSPRSFEPTVYTLRAAPPVLKAKCIEWGFSLVDMDERRSATFDEDDFLERLIALRDSSRRAGVTAAVYFSTYEGFVCLASSVRLAPVQLYWTMGFHSLVAPGIDGYLAAASLSYGLKTIADRKWRTLPFPFPDPFRMTRHGEPSGQEAEAKRIRGSLLSRFDTILGAMHRPEKLDNEFMDALSRILLENPRAVFLWFGTYASQKVMRMMEERGISDRCLFMGWVDTQVYARVLDIHLDTFGLPAGLTMAETFSCGGAYVLKFGVEAGNIGLPAALEELLSRGVDAERGGADAREIFRDSTTGADLAMLAKSAEEYVGYANRLIADRDFRAKVGKAARKFMERYYHDSSSMAAAFSRHLAEVIQEKRKAVRGTPLASADSATPNVTTRQ